jgi:AcrR family transcriptional regulator
MSMGERISADKLIDGRTRRRLERSNDVYLAAVGLFIDQGYDATTMDDIADRADVSRASVFNYFPRKVQFLEEWASRRRHQAVDAVRLKHLEDDPIGDILARYFDELARSPFGYGVFRHDLSVDRPRPSAGRPARRTARRACDRARRNPPALSGAPCQRRDIRWLTSSRQRPMFLL